ncbi:purine and uridine phosphorylase [Aureobasidium sp. EXF-8846]|nr:purine and uridine phosphorylase [Aureobasidium sp. EXF-8846]
MALSLQHIQIGWISALPIEALLAEIMLDELIEQAIPLPPNDNNIYTYGRINIAGTNASHVVAIAQLPLSTTGKASAATVANNMRRTFPNLKFGIMVGIAGGVWTEEVDVRLGDIVVGVPDDGGPGIIQYDHGKAIQESEFILKGILNKAPDLLRTAAGLLKRKHMRRPGQYVSTMENEEVKQHAPRPNEDNLFSATYVHQQGKTCKGCNTAHLRERSYRTDLIPKVHHGAIASGDQVVKDAIFAERIQRTHNIMCFEMEAAGLDAFPCLVVRGISDYADTHKNDDWHAYAAGTAAAYAKELLSVVPLTAVAELSSTVITPQKKDRPVFVLQGIGGAGKSETAIKFAAENQDRHNSFWGIFWIDADDRQKIEQGFADIARMQIPPLKDTTSRNVIRWLATTKETWLLILDNCDDPAIDFARYMPSRGGSVIITTRLTECRIHGTWKNIDELGREDAKQLLLKASGLEGGDQKSLIPVAESVVSILGQHALALVHAGAYIRRGHCTLSEYVQFFRDERSRLMKFKPEQQASRHGSVYTTFEVTAKTLASSDKHDSHLALRLLDILAFLDREAVEEEVFISAFSECHKFEADHGYLWEENEVQLSPCCAVLSTGTDSSNEHQSGPVKHDGFEGMTDMSCKWRGSHRYTGECEVRKHEPIETKLAQPMHKDSQESNEPISGNSNVPDIMDDSTLSNCVPVIVHSSKVSNNEMLSTDAVDIPDFGNSVDDDGELDHLDLWHCDRIRSSGFVHGQKNTRLRAASTRLADLSLIRFSNNRISMHPVVHEWARVRLNEVARQDAWEQVLSLLALSALHPGWTPLTRMIVTHTKTCTRNLGGDEGRLSLSLNIARALFQLATCCHLDKKNEASLVIFEALFESPGIQPHTRSYKNSLVLRKKAECLGELGRPEEMQSCVDQVLQSVTCWYEPDSWEAYSCLMLLANARCAAGNFRDAVDLLEPLYERMIHSPVFLDSDQREFLQTLSDANHSLGNSERAIALLVEELEITQKKFPLDDPAMREILSRLSEVYIVVGEAEKAVTLLKDAVKLKGKQDPPHHTWHWMMVTLARAYLRLYQYDEAIPILEAVSSHDVGKQVGDDESPTKILNGLAIAYLRLDKPDRAVPLFEEVVEANRSSRLPTDPGRLESMSLLAEAYLKIGKPEQAVLLLEEVVKIDMSRLPPDDPERCRNMDDLAEVYLELDKPHQAVPLLEEVVKIDKSRGLEYHGSIDRLAQAYITLAQPDQAVLLLEEVVELNKSVLSSVDMPQLAITARLAQAYINHDRPNQAVPLLVEVVDIERSSLPPDDSRRLDNVENLAEAYIRLNEPSQVVILLEELINNLPPRSPTRISRTADLAIAYLALSKPSQAVTLLEELSEDYSPDGQGLSRLLAKAYLQLDNPSQAIEVFEDLVSHLPADGPARVTSVNLLATAYLRLDKPDLVVTMLEELVDCLPADLPVRLHSINLLADAYNQLDKPSQVMALLEEVAKCLPADAIGRQYSIDMLSEAYLQLDKPSEAVALLEEVIKCSPNGASEKPVISTNILADAYLRLGKLSQAVVLLEELINSFPADAPEKSVNSITLLADAYYQLDKPSQAATLLEELVERFSADDPARLESVNMLANSYLILDKPDQTVILLEDLVKCLPSDPSEEFTNSMELLAEAFWKLDRLDEEVSLLEFIVAWNNSHLAEDNATRLVSLRRLARGYTRLGTREKVQVAVSLLEEVMEKGKNTLHADSEDLRITKERLADAQEKLRQVSQSELLVGSDVKQDISNVTADRFSDYTVHQHIQSFTKRAALMF